jgi:hypothetical protein
MCLLRHSVSAPEQREASRNTETKTEKQVKRLKEFLVEIVIIVACYGFIGFALVYCWVGQLMIPKGASNDGVEEKPVQ